MTRSAVFISHANPEDNEFAIWLGAHLSGAGYEVWADVLRLRGGEDWARKLEKALRERACKVLLVATPTGAAKQGVRNEIQIATEVAKKIDDNAFIIPLRLQEYDSPFQIAQAQYIDFMSGWGQGLAELFETLDSYKVPHQTSFDTESTNNWRAIQLLKARALSHTSEKLVSNWIRITNWPETIRYFEFQGPVNEQQASNFVEYSPWPVFLLGQGFYTFAGQSDLQSEYALPIALKLHVNVAQFLENGDQQRSVDYKIARNVVSHLTKWALETQFKNSNLLRYTFANGALGWCVPSGLIPDDKVSFKWEKGPSGKRQLAGEVTIGRSKYKWHFGVSAKPWISRNPQIRLAPRLIFSEDGFTPLNDDKYMHRLRRSVPKSWRNARWRDMLLGFIFWLGKGERFILLKAGSDSHIRLEIPPIHMTSPISIKEDQTETSEETEIEADDPVFAVAFDEDEYDDREVVGEVLESEKLSEEEE